MNAILLCAAALSMIHTQDDRRNTCMELVEISERVGVPPHIVVATAMVDTRMNKDAVSPAGAVGALQILKRWHCKEECDPEEVGVHLLYRLRIKYKSWEEAWCHYSAGTKCTDRGRKYAQKVRSWVFRFWTLPIPLDEGIRPPRKL